MTTRKELTEALRERYSSAPLSDRIKILDEFVALTGYHRKHAIRVLGKQDTEAGSAPVRNRLYDEAVRQALTMLWEAADRVCGKRLKALIPTLIDAMERHGHLDLDPVVRSKLLQVSAASLTMPSSKGVPQAMPSEIMNFSPQQRIAPNLGVDLDDWIALVNENMGRVIALPPRQHIHGRQIERHRVQPAVFLIGCRYPKMAAL